MSATDPFPHVGVFVSPLVLEHNDEDGHFYTSPLEKAITKLGLSGSCQVYQYFPRIDEAVDPNTGLEIPGGRPYANVTLYIIHFANIGSVGGLDSEPDVWRLFGTMTEAQRNATENAIRSRGLTRFEITGMTSTEQMARHVAILIREDPNFSGFPDGWFK